MSKNAWGYLFAGISALAGIVYLYQSQNQQAQAPVTNVFPPINTGETASDNQSEPLATDDGSTQGTAATKRPIDKAYPIYIV